MATKQTKKIEHEKQGCRCLLCGKIGEASGSQMIHVKCALEYVQVVLGYGTYKFRSPLEWSKKKDE